MCGSIGVMALIERVSNIWIDVGQPIVAEFAALIRLPRR